jgi:glycosyltransferase involved in cell wall biosynthesis
VRFSPDVVFVPDFSVFTLCALAVKILAGSRLVLLWDGISPSKTFLDCPLRLTSRRLIARYIDAVISNTQDGVEYLQDVIGIPPSKILHHPYQVPDIALLETRRTDANNLNPQRSPSFLFVGRLIESKGVRELLKACSLLVQKGSDCFSVVIVGTGADEEDLHHEASTLGLNHIVHWVGAVNYGSLGSYYRSSDVFVFPTLDDIFGVVLLEAMCFGKPILCSRYAGSKELVEHGSNGFVCDPLNHQELADYMERFIRDPGLSVRFGARSKEIISRFTPRNAAKALATLVRKVLD